MKNIFENIRYMFKNNLHKQCKIYARIKKSKTFTNAVEIGEKNRIDKYKNLKHHKIIQVYLIDLIWFMNTVIVYTSGRIFC
jgi:hypothetical protein